LESNEVGTRSVSWQLGGGAQYGVDFVRTLSHAEFDKSVVFLLLHA
jgi:hypothetical protein